jgi:hypothetical protein
MSALHLLQAAKTHTENRGYSQSRFLPQRAFTVKSHSEAYVTAERESTLLSSGAEQLCTLPYPVDLYVVNTMTRC